MAHVLVVDDDPLFREIVMRQAGREEILLGVRRVESALVAPAPQPGKAQ